MAEIEMSSGLMSKVQEEYQNGFNAINNERDRKRDSVNEVLPLYEGEPTVNLLYRNIQLENSVFVTDDLSIKYSSEQGVLGKEMMDNANYVAKYDYMDMDLDEFKEEIVQSNGYFGVAVTAVLDWDDEEQQPISTVVDALSIIPDPKCWKGSKMRYIGFERRMKAEVMLANTSFKNKDAIELGLQSEELRKNDRAFDSANGTTEVVDQEGLVDVYDHFTTYKGTKYLTTWIADRTICIRMIEIEPMSEAERKNPTKIKYPVQIHRRKPRYKSFFGYSIIDETLPYQKELTKLLQYDTTNARLQALGPDTFIASDLGIDIDYVSNKKPGGRMIEVDTLVGGIQQSIYKEQHSPQGNFTQVIKQELNQQAQDTTGINNLAFGQSLPGGQTKGEVQTLMQNTNNLLSWIAGNYMKGMKEYWMCHYTSYFLNMSPTRVKRITYFDKGQSYALELKRKDFVADGKVFVEVKSKQEEKIKRDKEYTQLLTFVGTMLPNIETEYGKKSLLRKFVDRLPVEDVDAEQFVPQSPAEMKARANVQMLNRDMEIEKPDVGEDYQMNLDIYKNEAIKTPATFKAIAQNEEAILNSPSKQEAPQGKADPTVQGMAMNQQSNANAQEVPSITNVTA